MCGKNEFNMSKQYSIKSKQDKIKTQAENLFLFNRI